MLIMKEKMKSIPKECYEDIGKAKTLVCGENKSKYTIRNKTERHLLKIYVDGCLITAGNRCDFAVDVDNKNIYLIELKGNDVRKACIQLLATYKYFKKNFDYTYIHCRFVSSKVSVPAIYSYEFKQLLHLTKKNEVSFKYASRYLEDVL